MVKALLLMSGGLDSMLAAKILASAGVDVTCLAFTSPFFDAGKAKAAARQLNLPLIVEDITEEFLIMFKSPRYGYGKGMNPCIDCHTLMLAIGGRKMESMGFDFIATGEVLGQRPMSQNKQSLNLVAKNSGYADHILRPLSARLLMPIKAEREGKIDRSRLLAISGRGRKEQMRLADIFGIDQYPPAAGGCLLTDPMFAKRLRELLSYTKNPDTRDYHLLKYGRHFRAPDGGKIIVGRNSRDNEELKKLADQDDMICTMAHFPGPVVLIPHGGSETALQLACRLCVRYSDAPKEGAADVICRHKQHSFTKKSPPASREECDQGLISN